jgi:hypothetical protein
MAAMCAFISLCLFGASAASPYKDWSDMGELMDEAKLSKHALSDEDITKHNAENDVTWVAGRNALFDGATLRDAKVLMGTLQNTDKSSFLPYKAPERWWMCLRSSIGALTPGPQTAPASKRSVTRQIVVLAGPSVQWKL